VWDFEESVERRDVEGGTSRRAVLAQIAHLRTWLAEG
jgi:argininosuccinate lyase